MPLYEYLCAKCGGRFEIIQKFSDAALTAHAGCGGTVEKLISTSALQFKGSGFYITDYAAKKSGSSDAANGKTESKPAAAATDAPAKAATPTPAASSSSDSK